MTDAPLGPLELTVLLAVARLGEGAYGLAIRRDRAARTGRDHSVGAIYTTLQRLEDKALVTSWMSDPTPVRGGRAKRCYRVTALGDEALRASRASAVRLRDAIDAVWQAP